MPPLCSSLNRNSGLRTCLTIFILAILIEIIRAFYIIDLGESSSGPERSFNSRQQVLLRGRRNAHESINNQRGAYLVQWVDDEPEPDEQRLLSENWPQIRAIPRVEDQRILQPENQIYVIEVPDENAQAHALESRDLRDPYYDQNFVNEEDLLREALMQEAERQIIEAKIRQQEEQLTQQDRLDYAARVQKLRHSLRSKRSQVDLAVENGQLIVPDDLENFGSLPSRSDNHILLKDSSRWDSPTEEPEVVYVSPEDERRAYDLNETPIFAII